MRKLYKHLTTNISIIGLTLGFLGLVIAVSPSAYAAQPPVDLRTAAPFAILAGTPGITDAGNTSTIAGNVGLSPATGAGIGLLCSQVAGTIYSVDAAGPACKVTDPGLLTIAKNDLTAAFTDAAGRTPVTTVPTELGGTTKIPGVYDSTSTTFEITAGAGPLILDGQGDPSAVFIFEMDAAGTGLTVGPGSTVSLVNGAQACNVFWRVDTATIDTTAVFKGNILALNSISVANGANIEGRLLARNGSVSLINDTITLATCAATAPSDGTPSGGGSSTVGLPNAGTTLPAINAFLGILASIGTIIIAGLLFYSARKKRTVSFKS